MPLARPREEQVLGRRLGRDSQASCHDVGGIGADAAIGGELAAGDLHVARPWFGDDVLARGLGGVAGAVVGQSPEPGKRRERLKRCHVEISTDMPDQILDVRRVRRRMGQVALIGRVGGSDQSVVGPGHDVHHPPVVGARQDDGPVAEADLIALDDEMGSLRDDHIELGRSVDGRGREGAGGDHHGSGLDPELLARSKVLDGDQVAVPE